MEHRNIEGFEIAHPGQEFPWYRVLTDEQMASIRNVLKQQLGLDENASKIQLVTALAEEAEVCSATDADSQEFSLKSCLEQLGIVPRQRVMVNFYRYDDIDELRLTDVDKHFPYIWYSGSDDIDIMDETLSWIVSVSHDGEVALIKF
ncbi:MAG: hypothetical protein ABW088_16840 [Sedimenticola sp.]